MLYQAVYNDEQGQPQTGEPRHTEEEAVADLTALGFDTKSLERYKGSLVSFTEPCSIATIRV
jgi:hypothetical protein